MSVTINGDTGIDKITDGSVVQADLASGVAGTGPAFSAYQNSNTSITIDSPAKILAGTVVVQTGTSSNIGTFTSASTFAIEIGEIIK